MSNNIPITDGSGISSVAAEQIGTVKYQQIKVVGGETGSTSMMSVTPGGAILASIIGTPTVNFSGSGSILAINTGSVIAVLKSSSILAVPVGSVVTVWQDSSILAVPVGSVISVLKSSSIIAIASGSVITVSQGSVITVWQNSSVIAIGAGSVVALSQGSVITLWQSPSIVGTYAEDAAHTTADKGIFVLGVRNDAIASLAGADFDYTPMAVDSAGRTIIRPFSGEGSRIEGYASLVSTSVTTLVAAGGVGIRNFITDIMIANTGATTTLITFKDGLGSILGYTIAPTAGGSNMVGFAMPMRTGVNASFDFQPTAASSIIFATVKGFQAP